PHLQHLPSCPTRRSSDLIIGTLEAAHRIEKVGARTTGELVGLFAFDLPGRQNERTWLRAGIGVQGKLGDGVGWLMINATTKGETDRKSTRLNSSHVEISY